MDLLEPLVTAAIDNPHIALKMKYVCVCAMMLFVCIVNIMCVYVYIGCIYLYRSDRLTSIGNNGRYQTGHRTLNDEAVPKYSYIPS